MGATVNLDVLQFEDKGVGRVGTIQRLMKVKEKATNT